MSDEPIHSRGLGRSGPKRKTGCLTCRRRKVRCDEKKPVCSNCIRLRLDCLFVDRKASRASSMASTSPEQTRTIGHAIPFNQAFNQPTASPSVAQSSLPASTWVATQPESAWRFDTDVTSAFAYPFQDIFLSSIDNFDPASEIAYHSGSWTQGAPSAPSEVATDSDSVMPTTASTVTTTETETEPPHRDEERSRTLVDHFVKSHNPISVILPTDTEWASACRSLLAMAKQCECVLSAICALSALHLFITNQNDTLQEAFEHYKDASRQVNALLEAREISGRLLKGAFATLFLLTRVELMAQSTSEAKAYNWPLQHLQNAHHRVHQHSDQIQLWRGISKRFLTWTTLLQAKAEYNAGITALENSSEPLSHSTGDPFARSSYPPKSGTSSTLHQNGHTDNEDDTRTIAELAYDTMNQPAFDFFLKSQAFTSRIISLDAYHRQRGTVDTEFEILKDGQRISADLHALWHSRPATVSFLDDPSALEQALQPHLARKVLLNIRVYVANYYAQFIYLHRVAYKAYPATEDVELAVAKIVTLARSIDEDFQRRRRLHYPAHDGHLTPSSSSNNNRAQSSQPSHDRYATTPSTLTESPSDPPPEADAGLPASMLWPLFLAAIEGRLDDRTWLLRLMQSMDPHTVPNASRTAQLLEEVLRRQEVEGVRIDHRSVRKDLFDGELSVVY